MEKGHNNISRARTGVSLLSVDRAVHEFRRGRMVVILSGGGEAMLAMAGEGATPESLGLMAKTAGEQTNAATQVALTRRRAAIIGLGPGPEFDTLGDERGVAIASFAGAISADIIRRLIDPGAPVETGDLDGITLLPAPRHGAHGAAVGLAKIARLLPAAVLSPITDADASDIAGWAARHDLQMVDGGDIFQHERTSANTLERVSEARVPLQGAEDARVIAYRPADGGIEHLAIIIGDPAGGGKPPLVRLHSECFTGDLLGSLRCDCGDQLRGAIEEIATDGAGVLLYLAQEGRGIGLVNKLRAYTLQDGGLDTLDANEELGFDADERIYLPAARMLDDMGLKKIRLLTNNPEKVSQLSSFGIEITERKPHAFPSNSHNEQYLETKRAKGGHLF